MLKRWMPNILLVLGSLLVGLVLTEVGLRLGKVSYPLLRTYDEQRGFKLRAGASGWWAREGYAFVQINSQGYRDREHQTTKPEGTLRIAVLGDSYAEARSVALEDTFWSVAERELATCPAIGRERIEVLNFGVTDYGTAQEYLTLREDVWQYDPDIVLLAFFAGNDIRNNSKELEHKPYRPFYHYRNNELVLDESFKTTPPYRLMRSWPGQLLFSSSDYLRSVQLGREAVVRAYLEIARLRHRAELDDESKAGAGEEGVDFVNVYNQPADPVWEEAWQITEGLITMIADETRKRDARFQLVTVSHSVQVEPDPATRKQAAERLGIGDLLYPEKRLSALGKREKFDVLTLAEPLQAYAEKEGVFLHGFENTRIGTGHWNEAGHRIAGELIARHLCESAANHAQVRSVRAE